MTIYALNDISGTAWDVTLPSGHFVGVIVKRSDGTFRHYYNMTATKGSAKKFATIEAAVANIDARRARRRAINGTLSNTQVA